MFVPKGDNTYKVYEQKNAIQKDSNLGSYYITEEKYEALKGFSVQPCDIIVSCAGTIGETYVLPSNIQDGIINQALMIIRLYCKEIERFYLLYFDFILKKEACKNSKGTAIKNIPPFDILKNFYLPMPPIAEQKRILDEVNKWMSLIDTIDTGAVSLFSHINQAKSKILDLAIHGKLVPQDPADEPAAELLRRINPKAEITSDNAHYGKVSFDVPKTWTWTTLGKIGDIVTGNTPSKDISDYYGGEIPFFKPADLDQGINTSTSKDHLTELGFEQSRKLPAKSVLVTCIGATIGKTGLISTKGMCNQQINAIVPSNAMLSVFLYYVCISNYFQQEMKDNASATTLPILNKNNFAELTIPIPPLAEQHRIVAKIEELFAQLDLIEAEL